MEPAFRLVELLGALSLTTDLGAGVPFEKGLRTCAVAAQLADAIGLPQADRVAAYYAALLRSLGCTAHASTFAELFDDDVAIQRELKVFDVADPELRLGQTARFSDWAGRERAEQLVERFAAEVPAQGEALARGSCEVSAALGTRLGLPEGTVIALDEVYERYDGNGFPAGRRGDELTVAAGGCNESLRGRRGFDDLHERTRLDRREIFRSLTNILIRGGLGDRPHARIRHCRGSRQLSLEPSGLPHRLFLSLNRQ